MKVETVRVMSVVVRIISTPASHHLVIFSNIEYISPFSDSFWLAADDDNQAHSLYVSENTQADPLFRLNAALTRN